MILETRYPPFDTLTFARAAQYAYFPKAVHLSPPGWSRQQGWGFENFFCCLFIDRRSGAAILAFRGTDSVEDWTLADLYGIGMGMGPLSVGLHMNIAMRAARQAIKASRTLWLTGHSLGGAYVQLVCTLLGLPGVSFNAPGVNGLLTLFHSFPSTQSQFVGQAQLGAIADLPRLLDSPVPGQKMGKHGFIPDLSGFITNYAASGDIIHRFGEHLGVVRTIKVAGGGDPVDQHKMPGIVSALQRIYGRWN